MNKPFVRNKSRKKIRMVLSSLKMQVGEIEVSQPIILGHIMLPRTNMIAYAVHQRLM